LTMIDVRKTTTKEHIITVSYIFRLRANCLGASKVLENILFIRIIWEKIFKDIIILLRAYQKYRELLINLYRGEVIKYLFQ
jgi:hypothetical protein